MRGRGDEKGTYPVVTPSITYHDAPGAQPAAEIAILELQLRLRRIAAAAGDAEHGQQRPAQPDHSVREAGAQRAPLQRVPELR